MKKSGPILFCGFNSSAQAALEELQEEIASRGLLILSRNEVPAYAGVKHIVLDYLNIDNLRSRKVGLKNCSICVVFAELRKNETPRIVDMHTELTVYNIKKEHPEAHIIAEILDRDNISIIQDLHCDDIIFKETIDYNLITNCILHPNISPIIYDLLQVRGKKMRETTVTELGFTFEGVTFREIRLMGLEQDVTYLGYIANDGTSVLMPPNKTVILQDYRLIYIE